MEAVKDDAERLAGRRRLANQWGGVVYVACLLLLVAVRSGRIPLTVGSGLLCCWGVLPSFLITRQLVLLLAPDRATGAPQVSFPGNPLLRWASPDWWQRNKLKCLGLSLVLPPCWIGYGLLASVPLLPFFLGDWRAQTGFQLPFLYLLWTAWFVLYLLRNPAEKWVECDLRSRRLTRHAVQDGCRLRWSVSDQKAVGVGVAASRIRRERAGTLKWREYYPEMLLADGTRVPLYAGSSSQAAQATAQLLARQLLVPFVGTFSAGEVVRSHWGEWRAAEPELDMPPVS